MKNGILKKSLSVFLAILMIVPTLFATGAPGLLSLFDGVVTEAEAAIAGIRIVVPETIYLDPKNTTNGQYYVNNTATGATTAVSNETSAKVYITYPDAKLTSVTATATIGTETTTVTLSSGLNNDYIGTTFSSTASTLSGTVSLGKAPSAGGVALIEWVFVFDVNGKTQTHYAYSVAYSPWYMPVGAAARAVGSWHNTYACSILWVSGVHSYSDGDRANYYYANADNFLPLRGNLYSSDSHINPTDKWVQSGDNGLASTMSYQEINESGVKYHARANVISPTAILTVDTSRYNNFNQIPNFKIGFMLTKTEGSTEGGTNGWYVSDYGTSKGSSYYNGTDRGSKQYTDDWNDSGTKLSEGNDRTKGVRFNESWNKSITGTAAYRIKSAVRTMYKATITSTGWNNNFVNISVTGTNKGALRTLVQAGATYAKENYTSDTWAAYKSALETAATNLGDPTVTVMSTDDLTTKESALETTAYFDANGGTLGFDFTSVNFVIGGADSVSFGRDLLLGAYTATRTGYTHQGWALEKGLTEAPDPLAVGHMKTVYAVWKPNTYTVYFDGNGQTDGNMSGQTMTYDTSAALNANSYTRTGYTFDGWNTAANGSGTAYADSASVSNLRSAQGDTITLYAQWKVNYHTVKFVNDAGNEVSSATYAYGTPAADIVVPANTAPTAYESTENHYVYNWQTVQNVTGDATYYEDKSDEAHTVTTTVTPPTCSKQGFTTYYCDVCKGSYDDNYTDKIPHTPGEVVVENVKDATCTANGSYDNVTYCTVCGEEASRETVTTDMIPHSYIKTEHAATCILAAKNVYTCSVCGDTYSEETGAALDHDFTIFVKDDPAATCTTPGTKYLQCSRCDKITTEEIDPLGHSLRSIEGTAATCTAAGTIDHYKCSRCNGLFADAAGNTALTEEDIIDPIKAHTPAEKVNENEVDATCTTTGSHDEVVYCTECGYEISRTTVVDPVIAHTAAEAVEENRKESTCTVAGSYESVVYCSVCNAEISRNTVALPLAAHTEGETVVENNVAPTCETDGSYDNVVYCTECGEELSRVTVPVDALGHTEAAAVEENRKESTCTEAGSYDSVVYCSVCNKELDRETVALPLAEHIEGETVVENATPETCTENGTYDNVVYCTECGEELSRDTVTVDATGHTDGEVVIENNVAPKCETDGSYDNVTYCTICGEETSRNTVVVPKTGHTESAAVEENRNASTCTVAGSYESVVYCSVCDKELSRDTVALPLADHTEATREEVVTAATCGKDGSKNIITYCTVCKADLNTVEEVIPATGLHNYDDGVVTTAPKCEVPGVNTFTCTVCDHSYTEEVEALEHNYAEATCDAPATCTLCGATTGDALGHDYTVFVETVPYTCTEQGYDIYECSRCDATDKQNYTDAAHKFGPVTQANNATCLADGNEAYKQCTACSKYFAADAATDAADGKDDTASFALPAAGHVFGAHTQANAATCTAAGTQGFKVCNNCGLFFATDAEQYSEDGKADASSFVIAALDHDFATTFTVDTKATCDTNGSKSRHCSRCSEITEVTEITARGHKIVDTTVKTAATCIDNGVMNQKCDNTASDEYEACEYTTTRVITATGHIFGETVAAVEPGCETAGNDAYKPCTVCNKYFAADADVFSAAAKDSADAFVLGTTGHNYDAGVITTNPTCTADGVKTFTCQNNTNHTYTVVEPKLGHDEIEHDAQAATCEDFGWDAYVTCSRCDYTTYKEIDAIGHDYDEGVVTTEPTCTEKGEKTFTCQNDNSHTYTKPVDALGHIDEDNNGYCDRESCKELICNHEGYDTKVTDKKDATCTADGFSGDIRCAKCNVIITKGETLTKLGHKDENKDHKCDNGCAVYQGEHKDDNKDHACDYGCNEAIGNCEDTNKDHKCDYGCGKSDFGTHADSATDKDHVCDYGCGEVLEECTDAAGDKDHDCDICGKADVTEHDFADATCTLAKTCKECGATEGEANGHNYVGVVTAPKCEAEGFTTYTCSVCNDSYVADKVSATGHDYEGKVTKEPTCSAKGEMTYTCKNDASHTYKEDIGMNADKHVNTENHTAVRETCTDIGYTAGTFCNDCGNWISGHEKIDAINHKNKVRHAAVAATCVAEGTIEYWSCPDCSKNFSDEACTTVVTELTTAINPDNHDIVKNAAKAPTCTEIGWDAYDTCSRCSYTTKVEKAANGHAYVLTTGTPAEAGKHTVTCPNCDENTEGHTTVVACTYADGVVTEPTCTKDGYTTHTCTACGYSYTDAATTASGHTFGDWTAIGNDKHSRTCTVCTDEEGRVETDDCSYGEWTETKAPACETKGEKAHTCSVCKNTVTAEVAALGHDMVTDEAVAPTCTETGLTEGAHCSRCDDATTAQEVVKALGHSFTNYTSNDDATCTADGTKTAKCDRCDATDTVADEGSVRGHSFTNYVSNNDATCTADGTKTAKCDRCEEKNTVADVNSALGHAEVAHEAKAATCTENGWDAYVTCSRCSYTTKVEKEALGHDMVTDAAVAPTCTATGLTEGSHCSRCNDATTAQEVVEELGHSFTNYTSNGNATCTADGTKTAKCDRCEVTDTITDEGSALGHLYKDADCNAPATCARCGDETGDALGHSFTNYVSDGNATCTADGTKTAKCDRCDATDNVADEGSALGHSFTDYVANGNATCSADGTKTAKCDRCEETDTITDAGSVLGHSFTNYESNDDATCTADGTKTAKCDRCDATDTLVDADSALGHSFTNYESNDDATCTADGTKTAKCDRCDATDTLADTDSALGHSFTNYVSNNDATCTADGTKTAKCDRCDETETIADEDSALGHDMVTDAAVAATCTETGLTEGSHCSRCNDATTAQEIVKALGHSFTNYESNDDATCTADGTKTAKCDRCDATDTLADADSALGHSFTNYVSNNDATCTADGTKTAKCDRCDETETIADADTALGHSFTTYVSNNNATCTADGTKTAKCDLCDETETIADADTALGHSFTNYAADGNATCTADGTKTAKCDRCDATDSLADEGSAIGHNYVKDNLVRPTKQADGTWGKGQITYVCTNDAKHVKNEVVERANYADYDAITSALTERKNAKTLDAGVRAEIENLLAENTVALNLIESEQADVTAAAETLETDGAIYLTTYTVKFIDMDGEVLASETVYYGCAATAPEAPAQDGFVFTGWDSKYTNIQAETTVTATYREGDVVVDVNKADVKLAIGETKQIAVSILPEDAQVDLTWTSADPSIATVDENGVVTGVKVGITTVTVTAFNGEIKENVSVYVYNSNTSHTVQLTKSSYGYFVVNGYSFYDTAFINVNAGQEFKFQFALNSQYNAEDMVILVNGQELSLGEDNYFTIPCMTDNLMIMVIHAPGGSTNGDNDGNNGNNGSNTTAHSCWCHSSNRLLRFLWKILMIFCKLFGIESYHYCACGDAHW